MIRRCFGAALLVIMFATSACSSSGSAKATATSRAPAGERTSTTVRGASVEYTEHGTDWVLPGRDYDNSRATTSSTINAGTVDQLEVGWSASVGGSLSTVPLIVGDTIYVQDGAGIISAIIVRVDICVGRRRRTASTSDRSG